MSRFGFFILTTALWFSPITFPCDYTNDPEMQSKKANCLSASKEWNCRLNRCMTTAEAYRMKQEFQKCEQLSDIASKEECFLATAEKQTGFKRNAQAQKNGWETLSVGISSAYALLGAIAWYSKNGGKCLSRKIMVGGSAAHLATHFLLLKKSKKKFDDIAARAQSTSNDYNAQLRAFYLLKEEQQAIKRYAKRKKLTYTVVSTAYAGALATAIMEKRKTFNLTPCQGKKEPIVNSNSPSSSPFNFSRAKNALSINSSTKVAIYSGIGMGLAFKLRQEALAEENKSEHNIKHIENIIAKFKDSMAAYCPQGREDLKKPHCYCYTDKGEPHSQRTQSATCQKLWTQDNINYAVKANSYQKQDGGLVGCMNLNGEFDPDCKCRKYKNTSTGNNLCMKSSQNIVIPSSLKNNLAGVGEALAAADVLTGASSKNVKLNPKSLDKAATRTKHYAEKLLKQYNRLAPSRQYSPIPLSPSFVETAVKKLANPQRLKRFGARQAAAPLTSANSNISPTLSQAIKTIDKKKSVRATPSYQKKSSQKLSAQSSKKQNIPLNWLANSPPGGTSGKTLQIQKTKSLHSNAKNADIHIKPRANIWKIISKRYLLSGIPQLFKGTSDVP